MEGVIMEWMMEGMMMGDNLAEKPKGHIGSGRDWTRQMLELPSSAPYVGCLRISTNNCTWRLTRELHGEQHQFVVTAPELGVIKHWARSQGAWALDQSSSLTDWTVTAKVWSKMGTLGSLGFRYVETSLPKRQYRNRRAAKLRLVPSVQNSEATVTPVMGAPDGIAEELARLRTLVEQIAAHVFAMRDHQGNLGGDQR